MSISVLNPGLLTTVQDQGRTGYQCFGVSRAGACDGYSAALANILVNNKQSTAVLEITFMGPMLRFNSNAVIAITGADLSPMVNGVPVPNYTAIAIQAGQILSFGAPKSGCRAYLAVAGGFKLTTVMGSYATDLKAKIGGFNGRRLQKGDEIPLNQSMYILPNMAQRQLPPQWLPKAVHTIRVLKGEQWDRFTAAAQQALTSAEYTLTPNHDRMGMRLEGAQLQHTNGADVISEPVSFGTVQVPGTGQPIIMLADCQTIGGYTKIAHVATVDFTILGQLKAGDKIRFELIDVAEAQRLLKLQRQILQLTEEMLNGKE